MSSREEHRENEHDERSVSLFLPEERKDTRDIEDENQILKQINAALIRRIERSSEHRATGFSLFQSAILLEEQVRTRTDELRSALRKLEQTNHKLEQAKEHAEYLNATKTKFLAAASHDLLQPLNAAKLNMSALKQETVSKKPEQLISRLDRSLTSLDELLRTLFDISKLDAGVTRPSIVALSTQKLFSALRADFAPLAREKHLTFKSVSVDEYVKTDPIFLRRILQNLISNAIRYTARGGVLVGARKRTSYLEFEVWDTGSGISKDEQLKIFDEFHRGSNTVGQDGLGLGLSIVKRMADSLGHKIKLKTVEGKGTCFKVRVPLIKRADNLVSSYSKPILKPSNLIETSYIALVEDNAETLLAMSHMLSRWGAAVISARSGQELLLMADEMDRHPDLIIADYHLEKDYWGAQVISDLRTKLDNPIPAIVVTAEPTSEIEQEVRQCGAEFMLKPVEPAELRALINHLLQIRLEGIEQASK